MDQGSEHWQQLGRQQVSLHGWVGFDQEVDQEGGEFLPVIHVGVQVVHQVGPDVLADQTLGHLLAGTLARWFQQ